MVAVQSNQRMTPARADASDGDVRRARKVRYPFPASRGQLKGGPAWAAERLIGRVRYLAKKIGTNVGVRESFDGLEALLKPQAREWVEDSPLFGGERFSIQSLLDDIATLRAAGQTALDPWWLRLGWNEGAMLQDEEVIRRVLHEDYRRMQTVYAEVVREMAATNPIPPRLKIAQVSQLGCCRAPGPDVSVPTAPARPLVSETIRDVGP